MNEVEKLFLNDYFEQYRRLLLDVNIIEDLLAFRDLCLRVKSVGAKLIFVGNGASATIASHAATDFTQHGAVRSIAFNDHCLITAFANDYGYEHWVARALEVYADTDDVVVLISSSGRSPNILNAAYFAISSGLSLVTFSGFTEDNPLRTFGNPALWVDSRAYNLVESIHLIWVLTVANLLEHSGVESSSYLKERFDVHRRLLLDHDRRTELLAFCDICFNVKKCGGKLIFAGNGGSASIASHAATDFTKQSGVRAVCFNDHNLISAFSNDYGQEQWISKCLAQYGDPNDLVVLISCSGRSKNLINAATEARRMGITIVTFTGFDSENPLSKMGVLNFRVDSHDYNITEAIHSIWIFCVADMLMKEVEESNRYNL